MIGAASALTPLLTGRALWRVVAFAIVLAVGVRGVQIAVQQQFADFGLGEMKYATAGRFVGSATPPNSVVMAMQHSGSVRYYGGRVTLRYDNLDPRWLDRAIAWFNDHGVHPYALLEDWEVPEVKKRFAEQQAIKHLDQPPMATYHGVATVHLFDLLPSTSPGPTQIVTDDPTLRVVPPGPAPTLSFRQPSRPDQP
jgi:hypothetical protein